MPQPPPTISIVTPSFNQGRFIEATLASVLAQSHPPLEYVVMDGGSTDETVSILQRHSDRVRWTSAKDDGQADAIDRGFRGCTGDVVAWLNSDDRYPHADVLKRVAAAFASDPAIDIVYGDGRLVDTAGRLFRLSRASAIDDPKRLLILPAGFALQPSVFFRRQLYLDVGGIDGRFFGAFDYDLWLRLFAGARRTVYLPEVLSHATCHPDAKSIKAMGRLIRELVRIKRDRAREMNLSVGERLHMHLHVAGLYAYYAAVRTGLRRAV
jgi:glycosyltransferase involved in cell wall biosynthesis